MPQRDPDAAIVLEGARLGPPGRIVLHDVTVALPPGARGLVVGDNGSGKSTLLRSLAGLLPTHGGTIRVLGRDPLRARRTLHTEVGWLGHATPFHDELTGRESLMHEARLRGLGRPAVDTGIRQAGLAAAADQAVGTYSHGMRRRLALALALLGRPRLLLFDEPESGLDADGRRHLQTLLADLADTTVLVATHHPQAWSDWADHRWSTGNGRLHDHGPVDSAPPAGGPA